MQTEDLEGDLAVLGNALVYLHLVTDRVKAAVIISQYEGLLSPALDDLRQAAQLVRSAQQRIHGRLPSVSARQKSSGNSSEENHKVHRSAPRGLAPQKTGWRHRKRAGSPEKTRTAMSHNSALCDRIQPIQAQISADFGLQRANFMSHNPGGRGQLAELRSGCAWRPGGVSGRAVDKSIVVPKNALLGGAA